MVMCTRIDGEPKQLCFQDFPTNLLNYREEVSDAGPDTLSFQATDEKTGALFSVFIEGAELQRIGISLKIWKEFLSQPAKLAELVKSIGQLDEALIRVTTVASEHLAPPFLTFFTDHRTIANRVIHNAIYDKIEHSSGIKGVPGMYFQPKGSDFDIFINLKKSPILGFGAYGKVRKVLWLSAFDKRCMVVAKKVFKDEIIRIGTDSFIKEQRALREFSYKRGIISLIAGGVYDHKYVLFLPMYECDLFQYFHRRPFPITLKNTFSIISQWLEGLATLSEKGIHGDLSPKNLLLKRIGEDEIEAVISDFGTFRRFGEEQRGLTTINICPPEYFKEGGVTSKQDVWAMGLSLHEILAIEWLPFWKLDNAQKIREWASSLSPDWVLKYPIKPYTPPFIADLIRAMLDPRPDHRPSAKEAFERFSKGLGEA